MLIYTLQRIGLALLICITSMCLLFGAIRMIPGDMATIMLGSRATQEMRDRLNHDMGLDKPVVVQLGFFLGHAATGDLGTDPVTKRSIGTVILENLPYTLTLIGTGAWLVGPDRHTAGLLFCHPPQYLDRPADGSDLRRHHLDPLLRRRHLCPFDFRHRGELVPGHRGRRAGRSGG